MRGDMIKKISWAHPIPAKGVVKKLALLLIFLTSSSASAADEKTQRISPSQPQPASHASSGAFTLPPVGKDVQAWSNIHVAGFRFEGNTVFSTPELQALAAPYAGRRLSPTDLEELRTRITRLYIERGYISSGALLALPSASGTYAGDIVPIRIIEGRVDAVSVKGEDGLRKTYVAGRLVRDGEILDIHVLQDRFRLLLTDPLFDKINSRIIPGDAPGKAVLDVDIVRALPYSVSVFANNYRPPSIGSEAIGVTGWRRNLTGHGDLLEASLQHSRGSDPVHLAWSVPLGSPDLAFRANVDRGASSVVEEPLRAIDIESQTSGFDIGISRTLAETLGRKIELGLSYGRRENKTTLLGQPFSFTPGEPDGRSRVKVLRFSQDWTERWEKQALALRSVFAFGSNNADPASSMVPVADTRYVTWTGQVQFVRTVLENGTQILLRGSTQYTRDRLLPLERFAMGGVGTVRGYRENSVVRDQAYVASAEVRYPLWPEGDGKRSLHLISFVDAGDGWNKDEPRQKLSSVGLGLSWRQSGISADVHLARKLSKLPVETHGNLQDRGIHFQISYKP